MILLSAAVLHASKKRLLQPVNLNTATALELQQVPGIRPLTADKIVKMRKSYGQFTSVDDLRAIKGIGPKRMEKMREYATAGKSVAPKKAASSGLRRQHRRRLPSRRRKPRSKIRRRRTETKSNFKKKIRPEGRPLQKQEPRSAQHIVQILHQSTW
jgi:competence ComEA-like helix-hairpin-helix protein